MKLKVLALIFTLIVCFGTMLSCTAAQPNTSYSTLAAPDIGVKNPVPINNMGISYSVSDNSSEYVVEDRWNSQIPNGTFNAPTALVIGPDDTIYVSDYLNRRVQKFSSTGVFLDTWKTGSLNDTFFGYPWDIAMDPSGNLYVTDSLNNVIKKYSSDGTYLGNWGPYPDSGRNFMYPTCIAIDSSGIVYIQDPNGYDPHVRKFSADGTHLGDIPVSGSVGSLSVDKDDNLYVTNVWLTFNRPGGPAVQIFAPNGTQISSFGSLGEGDNNQMRNPRGLAVGKDGNLYIADMVNDEIKVLTLNGTFIRRWGSHGNETGQFDGPMGLRIDSAGDIYVIEQNNCRIQKFSPNGTFLQTWGTQSILPDGEFIAPYGIAVDPPGYVYVSDFTGNNLQKLTTDGTFVWKRGSFGTGSGDLLFNQPSGVAVAPDHSVYVTNYAGQEVKQFAADGSFIRRWGSYGADLTSQFAGPIGVAVNSHGNVYIANLGMGWVQEFTGDGTYINAWPIHHSPRAIAIDKDDNFYVTTVETPCISKFDADGNPLMQWGSSGLGDGEFNYPSGISVDAEGNVFVVDFGNRRIQKFSPDGVFLEKWGSGGDGEGQFSDVFGISVLNSKLVTQSILPQYASLNAQPDDSSVFVADAGTGSIQIFKKGISIDAITPSSGPNTASLQVTITGSNFKKGSQVTLTNSSIAISGSVTFMNKNTLKCTFPLTGAPQWIYNLTVSNPNGANCVKVNAFTITNTTPSITSLTPATGFNSGVLPVTIIGTGLLMVSSAPS